MAGGDACHMKRVIHNFLAEADLPHSPSAKTIKAARVDRALPTTLHCRPHHLMFDFIRLLPHCKRDAKLDTKNDVRVVNEAAELKNATSCVLFEARKRQDLYIWLGKTPGGPTVKCHAANIHTMGELKLTGNHLKGSRPLLNFSEEFDASPHFALVKEILTHVFSLPKGHKHSKPFYDHVLNFTLLDGRVWIRNYQIAIPSETKAAAEIDSASLTGVSLDSLSQSRHNKSGGNDGLLMLVRRGGAESLPPAHQGVRGSIQRRRLVGERIVRVAERRARAEEEGERAAIQCQGWQEGSPEAASGEAQAAAR